MLQESQEPAPDRSPAVNPIEARARDFLAQGRYRKARDDFKMLCRSDRAKYLPLLVQANVGLAREMLAKGLVSEAEQVVAYLKTIAPAAELHGLELELANKTGRLEARFSDFVPLLLDNKAMLSESDRHRLVDQVVLAFKPVPADDPGRAALAAEVRAVHEALQAVASQQLELAQDLIRSLSHRSLLNHWKLFIKGLTAFHSGDTERAARFFEELPPDSVPAKASQAYLLLTGHGQSGPNSRTAPEHVIEMACRLAGQPGIGHVLVRAERHWRDQRPREMYRVLREMIGGFPSESLDWLGALSDFAFNCLFILPGEIAHDYSRLFEKLEQTQSIKSLTELAMILRILCLFNQPRVAPFTLKVQWQTFLQIRERVHGSNQRLNSLAYAWLGEALSDHRPSAFWPVRHKSLMRDAQGAVEALQMSVQLDQTNLAAHLKLCEVYERLGMDRERNRLLDHMTKRFPDNPAVLVQAGRACLERAAFGKGLDYLQAAFHLDRLDPSIRDLLMVGWFRQAQRYYQQGRLDQGRQTLEQTAELTADDPANLSRARWTVGLRRGLLELLFGDRAQGETLLEEARAAGPFPAAAAFYAHFAYRDLLHSEPNKSPFLSEFNATRRRDANAAHAATLLRILQHWQVTGDYDPAPGEERLLEAYLKTAVKRPFSRDEARQLVELTGSNSPLAPAVRRFIDKVLRGDPQDPLFRLYDFLLRPFRLSNPSEDEAELEPILEEAIRRKDELAVQLARRLLDNLPAPQPIATPVPLEEDFEETLDVLSEPSVDDDSLPADLSPEQAATLAVLLDVLRNASEAEIRELRETRPKDMPEFVFDMMLDAARDKRLRPPLPKPTPAQRRPPPRDPNQLDLF
jgi:tetratricopeptide (TPR) repeat protein